MAEAHLLALRSDPKRCMAARLNGEPCRGVAVGGSGFCWAHDPALADDRAEARQRGGRNSAKIARLRALVPPRLAAVYDALEAAMEEVHHGALPPARAHAMAALARAMVGVLTAGEFEERVRHIEELAALR